MPKRGHEKVEYVKTAEELNAVHTILQRYFDLIPVQLHERICYEAGIPARLLNSFLTGVQVPTRMIINRLLLVLSTIGKEIPLEEEDYFPTTDNIDTHLDELYKSAGIPVDIVNPRKRYFFEKVRTLDQLSERYNIIVGYVENQWCRHTINGPEGKIVDDFDQALRLCSLRPEWRRFANVSTLKEVLLQEECDGKPIISGPIQTDGLLFDLHFYEMRENESLYYGFSLATSQRDFGNMLKLAMFS